MPFSMDNWSPQDAIKAYLHALHLRKERALSIIEPKCMELVAALAAGKRSKLMVEITSSSNCITPLTIALAVAAKQTGGKVIVYTTANSPQNQDHQQESQDDQLELMDLGDVVELVYGDINNDDDEELVLKNYKDIDFMVVDGQVEKHMDLLRLVDVNPVGSMVVGHNLNKQGRSKGCSFGDVLTRNHNNNNKKRGGGGGGGFGCSFVSLPIGVGMELTKIGSSTKLPATVGVSRKYKRFHVTFEN
ncbi:hypothetical protein LINPERPRIM_LOCUS27839 [Linum perenne]